MADSEVAQVIAVYDSAQVDNYFAAAAAALFAFDWMLTFDREVDLFWRRKVTVSSMLFLVNRYVPFIVVMIFAPWQNPPTTPAGCAARYYIGAALEIFQYVPWAVFSALRAYVLSSQGWPLAALVFPLALAPVAVNYATMAYAITTIDPFFGCEVGLNLPDTVPSEIFPIISRVSLLVSDMLVLAITCYKTFRTSRELKALNQKTSLSSILFRDGVLYFTILTILNILHLSFSLLSILNQNMYTSNDASDISILTEPITAILISRFLINLQEANIQSMHQDSLASVGTLNFNRVIGPASFRLSVPADCPEIANPGRGLAANTTEVDGEPDIMEADRS